MQSPVLFDQGKPDKGEPDMGGPDKGEPCPYEIILCKKSLMFFAVSFHFGWD